MTILLTQSDSHECGQFNDFDKNSDVLIAAPEVDVAEGIVVIRVKNLRKPVIVKSSGTFF